MAKQGPSSLHRPPQTRDVQQRRRTHHADAREEAPVRRERLRLRCKGGGGGGLKARTGEKGLKRRSVCEALHLGPSGTRVMPAEVGRRVTPGDPPPPVRLPLGPLTSRICCWTLEAALGFSATQKSWPLRGGRAGRKRGETWAGRTRGRFVRRRGSSEDERGVRRGRTRGPCPSPGARRKAGKKHVGGNEGKKRGPFCHKARGTRRQSPRRPS